MADTQSISQNNPMPARAGVGLRAPYYDAFASGTPACNWVEVHSENFFGGGFHCEKLEAAAAHYPVSLHCVGLSLGSVEPVDMEHLQQLKTLVERLSPALVSDHVSWSASGNAHMNDLLPLPYNEESLETISRNIMQVQDYLGRQILVENPSTYLQFTGSDRSEVAFLNAIVERTGCGLLLDINNIYVQAHNNGLDPHAYIDNVDAEAVQELHLAGHTEQHFEHDKSLLIDTHNAPVREEVWQLYAYALQRLGARPTLIEWDQDYPPLDTLLAQAQKADALLCAQTERQQAYVAG